jgi:hypothetical protein
MIDFAIATDDDRKKFLAHFPLGSDLTLQALKGHLLVEELLREILEMQLPTPLALKGNKGASFDCHQVICLVEAITPQSQNVPWIWIAAKKLNNIRNDLAHQLSPAGLQHKITDLGQFVMSSEPRIATQVKKLNQDGAMEFPLIVAAMCTMLSTLKPVLAQAPSQAGT